MTEKQQKAIDTIIAAFDGNTTVDLTIPYDNEKEMLQSAIERNEKEIAARIDAAAYTFRMELTSIRELETQNKYFTDRLNKLRKPGERTPVPTETRSPKAR